MERYLSSGFNQLDLIIGGFKPSNLVGIMSVIGMGGTSLVVNIALKAKMKKKVLFVTGELPVESIHKRIKETRISSFNDIEFIGGFNYYLEELENKIEQIKK